MMQSPKLKPGYGWAVSLLRCSLWALAATLVVGCGFHLRGAIELPDAMKVVAIEGAPPGSSLGARIRAAIESAGGDVVASPLEAASTLDILRENSEQRVSAVSSTGKASEYVIDYRLSYRLLNQAGQVLVPEQNIELSRAYTYNTENVLGSEQDATLVHDELQRMAIAQMFRQLMRTRLQPAPAKPVPMNPAPANPVPTEPAPTEPVQ